jgi:hypothetical protein
MTRFIWIRDIDKVEHYVNVNHIVRVVRVPSYANFSEYAYVVLIDDKHISLSKENFDTYKDVINKIGVAMA